MKHSHNTSAKKTNETNKIETNVQLFHLRKKHTHTYNKQISVESNNRNLIDKKTPLNCSEQIFRF